MSNYFDWQVSKKFKTLHNCEEGYNGISSKRL